ncbi:MAG TPA: protein kinase [Kofleriaceae bacterium]
MLGELLGRGGMAEVFAGHVIGSHGFQKPVAIKRLLPELANDHVFVERLIGEAKLLVGMTHGNIVSVQDLARDGDDVFLVMEYVDGPSLRQLLKARGQRKLSLAIATYIVQAAAAGLEFAHARPGGAVIHADISPSNLLLTTSGEVRVADFGIARREGGQAGVVEGKWAYMAPEQARGEPLSPRSDVFALGVVLYELITGQHPFGQRVTPDERDSGPIRIAPPRVVNPSVPAGLDAICMKALADNGRDRYARMQHLIDAIIDERFTQQWREGANDLAQAIREIAPGIGPSSAGPRTQHTDRPVTIVTRSLISQPHRGSSPRVVVDESVETLEQGSESTGALTSMIEPQSLVRTSALSIPSSGARTQIVEMPVGRQSMPSLQPGAKVQSMPSMPSMQPGAMPSMQPGAMRLDGSPANPYRLSASMLPSPELASVHGGSTITGSSISVIDVRDARASKWTFAVLGVAALFGVIAAIATQIAPSEDEETTRPAIETAAATDEQPTPTEQPATEQPATEQPTPTEQGTEQTAPAPVAADTATVPEQAAAAPAPANPQAQQPDTAPTQVAAPDEPVKEKATSRKARSAPQKKRPASAADATLRVETYDAVYASAYVNGERQEVPGARFELPAGRHTVRLNNPTMRLSKSCTIVLSPGKTTTLKVDLEEGTCDRY